jgi:hypothetical protein
LLTVDPTQRFTAEEALNSSFFQKEIVPTKTFFAKRKFRVS